MVPQLSDVGNTTGFSNYKNVVVNHNNKNFGHHIHFIVYEYLKFPNMSKQGVLFTILGNVTGNIGPD